MRIDGPALARLRKAILNEFSKTDFEKFLLDRHNIVMDNISSSDEGFEYQLSQVLPYFNYRYQISVLMSALIAERSGSGAFQKLTYDLGILPQIVLQKSTGAEISGLEALVNEGPLFDVNVFLAGITTRKRCVCRIKVAFTKHKSWYGTGFLVGEDLLLTNYHVLKPILDNPSLAPEVICKFDYEIDPDGKQINPGFDIGLHPVNPVVAYSPNSKFDNDGSPDLNINWPPDQLDYALVRLEKNIGAEAYGINADRVSSTKATNRGWISLPTPAGSLLPNSNVIIIQHPDKQPMKIAIGLESVVGCDDNKQRVRYLVNTMGGSSGSPCFDDKFNWIAIHNMGDPNFASLYNQGIPAERIVEDLLTKGVHL